MAADFERALAAGNAAAPAPASSDWPTPLLRRFAEPWSLPEIKALPGERPPPETGTDDARVEFYWVGSDARIAGTLVHRCLQLIADGRLEVTADDGTVRGLTTRWLAEQGIRAEAASPIVERVSAAVSATLSDEVGRWILDGDGSAELALSGVYGGELVSVVLDRVRVDDDGTHWIVDYKSSSHEGGDLDGFLQVEANRYRPQLARYAAIYGAWAETNGVAAEVRCALYFPLLKSFVEVELQA